MSEAPYELVRKIRGSICVLGPLLARTGRARVALPGGDAIGSRPLDMHFDGLERMGADIRTEHGYIIAEASRLRAATIWLDLPERRRDREHPHRGCPRQGHDRHRQRGPRTGNRRPVQDARESWARRSTDIGSSTLEITGRRRAACHRARRGCRTGSSPVPGRSQRRQRSATLRCVTPARSIWSWRWTSSCAPARTSKCSRTASGCRCTTRPRSFDVVTLPYPGLPTDLQPQAIALLSIADGTAMITENMFEGRFMFCDEIARMGADVRTDGHHAVVRGRERLSGAPVRATDIRAGVGLVIAGLVAEGVTEVAEIQHIDRGYVRIEEQLRSLGADVVRAESDAFGG